MGEIKMKTRRETLNVLINKIGKVRTTSSTMREYEGLKDMIAWLDEQWAEEKDNTWREDGYVVEMTYLSSCIEIHMGLEDDTPYEDILIGILFWDETSDDEIKALYNLSS